MEPDYIVLRPGPGISTGQIPERLNGWWYDRGHIDARRPIRLDPGLSAWVAEPAGRFEVREGDGAVAEVWEVRPARPGETA